MKQILIALEDSEYEALSKIKGDLTWKEVLLAFLEKDPKKTLASALAKEPEVLLTLLEKELKRRKPD